MRGGHAGHLRGHLIETELHQGGRQRLETGLQCGQAIQRRAGVLLQLLSQGRNRLLTCQRIQPVRLAIALLVIDKGQQLPLAVRHHDAKEFPLRRTGKPRNSTFRVIRGHEEGVIPVVLQRLNGGF